MAGAFEARLVSQLREAALDVLRPLVREATANAASYAVAKAPETFDELAPKVIAVSGATAMAIRVLARRGRAAGGAGRLARGIAGQAAKVADRRGRRLPVHESVDVAADLQTVYDEFVMRHENSRRSWEGEIVKQIPCERVVWRSNGRRKTLGWATFHRLSDKLTRVRVTLDFQPNGLTHRQ